MASVIAYDQCPCCGSGNTSCEPEVVEHCRHTRDDEPHDRETGAYLYHCHDCEATGRAVEDGAVYWQPATVGPCIVCGAVGAPVCPDDSDVYCCVKCLPALDDMAADAAAEMTERGSA